MTAPAPFVSRGFLQEVARNAADDSENVAFTAEAIRETEAALLCSLPECGPMVSRWIPKSCIDDASEVYALGHTGRLVVKGWFATKQLADLLDETDGTPRAQEARDFSPPKPVGEIDANAQAMLDRIKASGTEGVMARPCKALIDLELRGLIARSGGPGVETVWRKAVQW